MRVFLKDSKRICLELRLKHPPELPHILNAQRTEHYSSFYDTESAERIEKRFAKDIQFFGYKFDVPAKSYSEASIDDNLRKLMDAFYQAYKNLPAIEFVLKQFFKNNGRRAWVVSDGGPDLRPVLNQFGGTVIYSHMQPNIKMHNWLKASQCIEWFSRIKWMSIQSTADHIMLLEDDVYIRGNLDEIAPSAPLIGPPCGDPTWGNDIPPAFEGFLNTRGKRRGCYKYYGGCGGSIFNRALFLESYDFAVGTIAKEWNPLRQLSKFHYFRPPKIGYPDFALTFLFNLSGHEYASNPEHTECHKHRDWKTNGKKIVHGYKAFYSNLNPKTASMFSD